MAWLLRIAVFAYGAVLAAHWGYSAFQRNWIPAEIQLFSPTLYRVDARLRDRFAGGDQVLSLNGRPLRTPAEWYGAWGEPGRPVRIEFLHRGQYQHVDVITQPGRRVPPWLRYLLAGVAILPLVIMLIGVSGQGSVIVLATAALFAQYIESPDRLTGLPAWFAWSVPFAVAVLPLYYVRAAGAGWVRALALLASLGIGATALLRATLHYQNTPPALSTTLDVAAWPGFHQLLFAGLIVLQMATCPPRPSAEKS